ncbi:hypothetical protein FQ154_19350 [Paeniglutamicibacter gangotriensis]|uniref:DUF3560 domain-containing protein n=1 Tax=Paeniglutamicibacter gangotriensis TaxID=254787 RepID=A0A5B0E613_9MICC|nr:hypothetical protein [Paeniglutamicibacter gangotriensis]KAA0973210.1 hypothetical protein FQ154_19350 [Paeniglutamicibacter gangotriensis]
MSRIYLCHSLSHGTSAHGSALGDGSNAIFKTHGWQWARTRSAWYVPESKGRDAADSQKAAAISKSLERAGHHVSDWTTTNPAELQQLATGYENRIQEAKAFITQERDRGAHGSALAISSETSAIAELSSKLDVLHKQLLLFGTFRLDLFDSSTVRYGDHVRTEASWMRVVRTGNQSVSVLDPSGRQISIAWGRITAAKSGWTGQ